MVVFVSSRLTVESSISSPHGVLPWLDAHNGAITSVATVILVIITGIYVVLTEKLVREARRDRDVAYQPLLSWRIGLDQTNNQRTAKVVNNSPASAYYCILASVDAAETGEHAWLRSDPFSIGPCEETREENPILMIPQNSSRTKYPDNSAAIAFCQNQFGYRFCFRQGTTHTEVWKPPAKTRGARPQGPAWVNWYGEALKNYEWLWVICSQE